MKYKIENILIKNHDGNNLSALLVKPKFRVRYSEQVAAHKTIIIVCHGFTGTKQGGGRALEMSCRLAKKGYGTILFDFAGCGESDGKWQDLTLSGQIEDLHSVAKWCRTEGFTRIILNGRSFGGTTALAYAASSSLINAVCTWSAAACPVNIFKRFIAERHVNDDSSLVALRGEHETDRLYIKAGFFADLPKHNILDYVSLLSPRRLLIIHGSEDQVVPKEEAELIYRTATEPKEMVIIDGADHRFSNHLQDVWDYFFCWIARLHQDI